MFFPKLFAMINSTLTKKENTMYHVIINPASRSGKGRKLWDNIIKPYLSEQHIEYCSHFSTKPGEVTTLAKEISAMGTPEAPVQLVVLGGDGTFNETLQGIRDFSAVILGYIPTGSSNDLARDLKISKDTREATERAFGTGSLHQMDVGCVTFADGVSRYYANCCGMGFDSAVCEETNRSTFKKAFNRIGLGKLAYLAIAVKQLLTAKVVSCKITMDDKPSLTIPNFLFAANMIHRYEGGGFMFCPDAVDNDGIFDICCAATVMPKWLILLVLPTAFFGKHFAFPGINSHRAKTIRIKTSAPVWLQTDGEILRMTDNAYITCLEKALKIRY